MKLPAPELNSEFNLFCFLGGPPCLGGRPTLPALGPFFDPFGRPTGCFPSAITSKIGLTRPDADEGDEKMKARVRDFRFLLRPVLLSVLQADLKLRQV
jgi:hypothetical protein